MAGSNVKRLVIELDQAADAPRGSVSDPDGAPMRFDGWLQLLAALEQLIPRPDADPRREGQVR